MNMIHKKKNERTRKTNEKKGKRRMKSERE